MDVPLQSNNAQSQFICLQTILAIDVTMITYQVVSGYFIILAIFQLLKIYKGLFRIRHPSECDKNEFNFIRKGNVIIFETATSHATLSRAARDQISIKCE